MRPGLRWKDPTHSNRLGLKNIREVISQLRPGCEIMRDYVHGFKMVTWEYVNLGNAHNDIMRDHVFDLKGFMLINVTLCDAHNDFMRD